MRALVNDVSMICICNATTTKTTAEALNSRMFLSCNINYLSSVYVCDALLCCLIITSHTPINVFKQCLTQRCGENSAVHGTKS